jgi:hypothetical protein
MHVYKDVSRGIFCVLKHKRNKAIFDVHVTVHRTVCTPDDGHIGA